MTFFLYLGMGTTALLAGVLISALYWLVKLAYRAAIQTGRIVAIYRKAGVPNIKRKWARIFGRELFETYTELRIGGYTLPYDVRKPIGHWYGG